MARCVHIPYCMNNAATKQGVNNMAKRNILTASQAMIAEYIEESIIHTDTIDKLSDSLIEQLDRTDTDHLAYAANQAINRHLASTLEVIAHYSDDLIDSAICDTEITKSVAL